LCGLKKVDLFLKKKIVANTKEITKFLALLTNLKNLSKSQL